MMVRTADAALTDPFTPPMKRARTYSFAPPTPLQSSSASSSATTYPCVELQKRVFPRDFCGLPEAMLPVVYDAKSTKGFIPLDVQDGIKMQLCRLLQLKVGAGTVFPRFFLVARNVSLIAHGEGDLRGIKYMLDEASGDLFVIDISSYGPHQEVAGQMLQDAGSQLTGRSVCAMATRTMRMNGRVREFDITVGRRGLDPESEENIGIDDDVVGCPRIVIEVEFRHRDLRETVNDVDSLGRSEKLRCFILVCILPRQADGRFPLYCIVWRRPPRTLRRVPDTLAASEIFSFGTAPLPDSVTAELRSHFPRATMRDISLADTEVPKEWFVNDVPVSVPQRWARRARRNDGFAIDLGSHEVYFHVPNAPPTPVGQPVVRLTLWSIVRATQQELPRYRAE